MNNENVPEPRETVIRVEKSDGSSVEWVFPPGWGSSFDPTENYPQEIEIQNRVRDALRTA